MSALAAATAGTATLGYILLNRNEFRPPKVHARSAQAGDRVEGLPEFAHEDVRKHFNTESRVWMTYRNGVYDVTDFIAKHPGAQNIMLAAGGDVQPFWDIYSVHKGNEQVFSLMEEYRIGNLREEDARANAEAASASVDPFANEPERNQKLIALSIRPFNAETPFSVLADEFYTPNDLFYVRSHLPTPDIDAAAYELELDGMGIEGEGRVLRLEDLKKFPKHTVTAAIQCGGNRRSEMNKSGRKVKGLEWFGGAIGNAKWGGARLSDVLAAAGVDSEGDRKGGTRLHVQFEGSDYGADGSPFGASIPLSRAIDPRRDVLLAYEMNGEPLPRDHGFPIRVVVPGVVGVRNVKWLQRITVADDESDSHWQRYDYKAFNPSVTWDNVDFAKSPAMYDMPVTSAICNPVSGSSVKPEKGATHVEIKGYAWSGQGNRIARVDLTADGGKTWFEAAITKQESDSTEPRHYGWTLWKAKVPVKKGQEDLEVWSKAVDTSNNVQPESFANIWNLRGLSSNAYYRAKYKLEW